MRMPLSAFVCAPSRCRKSGTSASGRGSADRSSPGWVSMRSGVRIGPGTTASTRRFARLAHSSASVVASAASAAFAAAYAPQYARGSSPRVSSVKTTQASGAADEQRQRRPRQRHRGDDIDPQHLLPHVGGLVLDRPQRAQKRRRMHEPVETAELRADRAGDVAEIVGGRRGQIQRQDRRLRVTGGDDLVVDRLELADDAPVQHDGRAARGARERERPAEAAGRTGDHDCAAGQVDVTGEGGGGQGHGAREGFGSGTTAGATAMIDDQGDARPGVARPFARREREPYNLLLALGV